MIDSDLVAPMLATPLALLLESVAPPHEVAAYRGVQTAVQLDALAQETAALASSTAVHDLGWLRRLSVRGEDRFRWLSGMVTNTVNDLPSNGGAWNLVLNAQGRIQGDLHVWREGDNREADNLVLEIAADQFDRLRDHLDHFIIMDDVELTPIEGETALGLTGPLADEVLSRLNMPTLPEPMTSTRFEWNGRNLRLVRGFGVLAKHYEIWLPLGGLFKFWNCLLTGGASQIGFASYEAFRIAEGIPAYGIDIAERDLPQETSQLRALHFAKGCYLGQEIVERIRSRGAVHRHLRHLELDGPVPASGTELTLDGKRAGHITSAAELPFPTGPRAFALAVVSGDAEARNQPLAYSTGETPGTARLLSAPPLLQSTESKPE